MSSEATATTAAAATSTTAAARNVPPMQDHISSPNVLAAVDISSSNNDDDDDNNNNNMTLTAQNATSSNNIPPTSVANVEANQDSDATNDNIIRTSSGSTNDTTRKDMMFPCIEQPLRITLTCNGYYLWGIRGNRVIARKKRSEKDEFRLHYTDKENGIVEIYNHKFGSALSVVTDKDGVHKVVCVKEDNDATSGSATASNAQDDGTTMQNNTNGTEGSTASEQVETNTNTSTVSAATVAAPTATDDDPEEAFDDEPALDMATITTTEDDRRWCFIKGANDTDSGSGSAQVILKSLRTGENLGVDSKGKVVLVADATDMTASVRSLQSTTTATTWNVDCVTGELCFLSNANQSLNKRLRCDMAGLLTLTDAWKGWEVFRFMEASHHYVKISSWMHSQWLLCSAADGTVTTCSHSESLMDHNPKGCCQWAIEKYTPSAIGQTSGSSDAQPLVLQGVIIRSKTHGRLLSVANGVLKTYSDEDIPPQNVMSLEEKMAGGGNSARWWNNGIKNMNASVKNMQRRMSSTGTHSDGGDVDVVVPQKETIVWQLEAAHLQTYYFAAGVDIGEKPKSLGPFPYVTPNTRQSDKIQLKRYGSEGAMRLFMAEKKQYIAISSEGIVSLVESADDNPDTEWIMAKPQYQGGGNVFCSKAHNLYLSCELVMGEEPEVGNDSAPGNHSERFSNFFNKKKTEPVASLVGSETIGMREVWQLEPCMPRAVSSEKITTFGTNMLCSE